MLRKEDRGGETLKKLVGWNAVRLILGSASSNPSDGVADVGHRDHSVLDILRTRSYPNKLVPFRQPVLSDPDRVGAFREECFKAPSKTPSETGPQNQNDPN